jgi:hypothetical protein
MSKFTKGPYAAVYDEDAECMAIRAPGTSDKGFLGLSVEWVLAYVTKGRPHYDDEQANAALFAAAPDLYEACKALVGADGDESPDWVIRYQTLEPKVGCVFCASRGDKPDEIVHTKTCPVRLAQEALEKAEAVEKVEEEGAK